MKVVFASQWRTVSSLLTGSAPLTMGSTKLLDCVKDRFSQGGIA